MYALWREWQLVQQILSPSGNAVSVFTMVLKVMSFGSMSIFLGMGFSVIWIYFLDINIWHMAAVYNIAVTKKAHEKAKAEKIEVVETDIYASPAV